jgi:hypothetical protein
VKRKLLLVCAIGLVLMCESWLWLAEGNGHPTPIYQTPTITYAANVMSWSFVEFYDTHHGQLKGHCDMMSSNCWVEVQNNDWHRIDIRSNGYEVWMYTDGELDLQNRPFRKTGDSTEEKQP